jgi:peptidoglycan/xylan/chitin deacetylase (PgdA/CDA1 family)
VPLSITFDDGGSIQYSKYFPILDSFNLQATFYIVTNWVGKHGFMDLGDISDLWRSHNEIGSHTHTHARLSLLTNKEVTFELETSKNLLSRFDCTTLAYPFGDYSDRIASLAADYYSGARTYLYSKAGTRGSNYNFDLRNSKYALGAFPMEHSIDPEHPILINLTLPQFKTNIENIVNKAVDQKAWTILVFHGSERSLRNLAQKALKHPLNVIRNTKSIGTSIKYGHMGEDEINKFQWLCEFLAANEEIQVMTVTKAIEYFSKLKFFS